MDCYSVRILRGLDEKTLAHRLLYQVYVEELGWIPPEGNPSNLRIEPSPIGNILTDDYDSVSIQFGGFYGKNLIGIHRIIPRINGRLDVEKYIEIPKFFRKNCNYEFTRVAVKASFRKSPIFPLILAAEIKYLRKQKCKYIISTSTFPDPGNFFCKIGATRINYPEFKYHVSDPKPVSLIVLFIEEQEHFNRLFTLVDKLKQKGKLK